MRDVDLAYLAGFVDADGFVGIQKSRERYYSARLGMGGRRRAPMDLAASIFGGTVYERDAYFGWMRSGSPALPAIVAIRPFLRIKTRQADLALELDETYEIGKRLWPFDLLDACEQLYVECKSLSVRPSAARTPTTRGAV